MKGKHPSGRPIRKLEKRSWGMWGWRRTDFVNPRLNAPPIKRITGATDLYAIGSTDWRVGFLPDYESVAKGRKP